MLKKCLTRGGFNSIIVENIKSAGHFTPWGEKERLLAFSRNRALAKGGKTAPGVRKCAAFSVFWRAVKKVFYMSFGKAFYISSSSSERLTAAAKNSSVSNDCSSPVALLAAAKPPELPIPPAAVG